MATLVTSMAVIAHPNQRQLMEEKGYFDLWLQKDRMQRGGNKQEAWLQEQKVERSYLQPQA